MPRRHRDEDDDDYDYTPPPPSGRPTYSLGGAIALGALAGLVSGEGALLISGLDFAKNIMGPAGVLFMWGLCFLIFILAPIFVFLGMIGGAATARLRSLALGVLIGALSGPVLVFLGWGTGAIQITVNNQPVKFTLNMAIWWSAILWIPGAAGGLFAGLLTKVDPNRDREPLARRRRRRYEEDDYDDEDDRERRRDRDDDDDRDRRRRR